MSVVYEEIPASTDESFGHSKTGNFIRLLLLIFAAFPLSFRVFEYQTSEFFDLKRIEERLRAQLSPSLSNAKLAGILRKLLSKKALHERLPTAIGVG